MTRVTAITGMACLATCLSVQAFAEEPNQLTDAEQQAGWKLLFDGKSTAGWRGYKSDKMPESWRVENGSLFARRAEGKSAGDIVTVDQYDDFELRVDWKMKPGHNSGIIYRVVEDNSHAWMSGPEFQVLDNERHMDGLNKLASAGACYAVFAPAKDATRPVGDWNQARIIARGKHVEHWLNGEKVVEYDVDTERWRAHVKTSKFFPTAYNQGDWGQAPRGHIALQDYGGEIEFRNIKILPLKPDAE